MRLDELWYGRSPLSILLAPLGWLYGAMMGLRRALYRIGILRSTRVAEPKNKKGNLAGGGAGGAPRGGGGAGARGRAGGRPGGGGRGGGGAAAAGPRRGRAGGGPRRGGARRL